MSNCSICLDTCEQNTFKLECSHSFCNKCITRWLLMNNSCPSCRANIIENNAISETNPEIKLIVGVENNIHMTKNRSRQEPLNYGIRINNRLAFLMADSQRGDYPPTDQSIEFFNQIQKELDIQLVNLNKILLEYTEIINRQIEENNINRLKF